jgi:ferredoxin
MAYKVKVDEDKCIGCGSCASICEKAFVMYDGANGPKAKPKKESVKELSCEKEAVDICPVQAISIVKS